MKHYEIGFVFFIASDEKDSIERKDLLLDLLDSVGIDYSDIYDDGEDWNIECLYHLEARNERNIESVFKKKLKGVNETWDYHYIKGTDNNYYWQP